MPDVQNAIQAILQSAQASAEDAGAKGGGRGGLPVAASRKVVCVSRDYGSGGDAVARLLAERLGVPLYDQIILDKITRRLNSEPPTLQAVEAAAKPVRDLWLYSLMTGQDLSAGHYKQHLINVVVSLARSGGVIVGRGGHLILARSGALRLRITASEAACVARVSAAEGLDAVTAQRRITEINRQRSQFVRDTFHERFDDPRLVDLTINTDHFPQTDRLVDLLVAAVEQVTPA